MQVAEGEAESVLESIEEAGGPFEYFMERLPRYAEEKASNGDDTVVISVSTAFRALMGLKTGYKAGSMYHRSYFGIDVASMRQALLEYRKRGRARLLSSGKWQWNLNGGFAPEEMDE